WGQAVLGSRHVLRKESSNRSRAGRWRITTAVLPATSVQLASSLDQLDAACGTRLQKTPGSNPSPPQRACPRGATIVGLTVEITVPRGQAPVGTGCGLHL